MQEGGKVVIVEFVSFGWRWGPPSNTKKNWNLRKLPNPTGIKLNCHTGLDKELQRNLFEMEQTQRSYARWCDEVSLLLKEELERAFLPSQNEASVENDENEEGSEDSEDENEEVGDDNDEGDGEDNDKESEEEDNEEEEEGVLRLRLGFGCHSGRHRSVAVVERFSQELAFQNVVDAFESRLLTTIPPQISEDQPDSSDQNLNKSNASKIGLILQARHRDLEAKGKKAAQTNKERRGGRKRGYEERRQRKQAYYS